MKRKTTKASSLQKKNLKVEESLLSKFFTDGVATKTFFKDYIGPLEFAILRMVSKAFTKHFPIQPKNELEFCCFCLASEKGYYKLAHFLFEKAKCSCNFKNIITEAYLESDVLYQKKLWKLSYKDPRNQLTYDIARAGSIKVWGQIDLRLSNTQLSRCFHVTKSMAIMKDILLRLKKLNHQLVITFATKTAEYGDLESLMWVELTYVEFIPSYYIHLINTSIKYNQFNIFKYLCDCSSEIKWDLWFELRKIASNPEYFCFKYENFNPQFLQYIEGQLRSKLPQNDPNYKPFVQNQ